LGIVFTMMAYASSQKDQTYFLLHAERAKAETLLLNILPSEIADRLKEGTQRVADAFESASVLFADIAGFTTLTEALSPEEMLEVLNQIYSQFDTLVLKHDVEKIRTIGDNYMVASGIPTPRPDHAQALAAMALDMLSYCQMVELRVPISFRIGINSGPMTAGIVGIKKFQYDVWGDAVNVASRMESSGVPNQCQITTATYELIKDEFMCERRGPVSIKGKGEMETWFLVGRK
jgi:class 3 adenylate cyclase